MLMKNICLLLFSFTLAAQPLSAQLSGGIRGSALKAGDFSYAPLSLFTSGAGRIYPFENGQMLQVGRRYFMVPIPDRGHVFSNWTPVDVTTFTLLALDESGHQVVVTNQTIVLPGTERIKWPLLEFTMQPTDVIFSNELAIITSTTGWQANFVPARNRFRK